MTAPSSCPHRPPCQGCPRFGDPALALGARAKLAELARVHGVPAASVISGRTAGFRHRARLAIRGRLGSPKVGLFEPGTHRVVHIPDCRVQHPLVNHVASVVRRALVDARVSSYSDAAHRGLARYLQVVIERSSQTAQVTIVANCPAPDPLRECLVLVRERLGRELHSLWFNAKCDRSNSILGPHFENLCGPPSVIEHFGGAGVYYPPGAFGQSNLDVAELLIEHLRTQIPSGARVTEFYAGVGAIGLSVLDRVSELRLNELNPASLVGLELGLAQLEPVERAKVSVLPGAAGPARFAASGAEVVIADPPRKGLDPELCGYLGDEPPERVLYVSCGLDSLRKDAAQLTSRGTLQLVALTAFNFFPFTEHVEILARFDRAR